MSDPHYPSVDIEFIKQNVTASGKLADGGILQVGATINFISAGNGSSARRTISVRQITPGEICFEQSVYLATKFNFLGALLQWLEDNKSWKDGGYVVKQAVV